MSSSGSFAQHVQGSTSQKRRSIPILSGILRCLSFTAQVFTEALAMQRAYARAHSLIE